MIWAGIGLFFGLHLLPSIPNLRHQLIHRLGENGYKGVYSILSLLGLVLLSMGYSRVEYQELWSTPVWANHLALTVMPLAFVLQVAAELKGHIRKKVKHPMITGIFLWALVHLINNGDIASLYLFGSFALYSVFSIISSTHRGKLPNYTEPKIQHDFLAIGFGLALFAGFLWGHEFLFGVAPIF
ncbi:MAG: NnrU family protein [Rhodospirillales bacterium]|nr:NnrU family protein [Rhodospirillales bacterium]